MTRRPVVPDDLFRFRFLMGADLAPDGRRVVYALSQPEEDGGESVHLHLVEVDSGDTRQLTTTRGVHRGAVFSPDGRRFAFVSMSDGAPQVHVMDVESGRDSMLTDLPRGVAGALTWSSDGRSLAFQAGPQDPADSAQPYRTSRTVWRADGVGVIDQALTDIYVVSADGSSAARRLTDDAWMNTSPRWSPDDREVFYVASFDPVAPDFRSRLRAVDLTGSVRDVTESTGTINNVTVTPDGRVVFLASLVAGRRPGESSEIFVFDPSTGTTSARRTTLDGHLFGGLQADMPAASGVAGALLVSADGCTAYASLQSEGDLRIVRIDLNGSQPDEALPCPARACSGIALRGSTLLYTAHSMTDPGQLHVIDVDTGADRRMTDLNADLLASLDFPVVDELEFVGKDGARVHGWYLRPPAGDAPFPTVLAIHGGPHAAWGHVFVFDLLMLTGAGYGVLLANQRGSTGYGEEFATAIIGDWGGPDCDDLLAAVQHVVDSGLADSDRLGVMGISGGGSLTGWLIGRTSLFKAACPENPLFNWSSFFGTSDVGLLMTRLELGATPYDDPARFARNSPISVAQSCRTPTLFLQHDNDYRCPAEQTEQYYRVLKHNGVPAEMLRFPSSGHNGSVIGATAHRRAQNEAILDWMNRYL